MANSGSYKPCWHKSASETFVESWMSLWLREQQGLQECCSDSSPSACVYFRSWWGSRGGSALEGDVEVLGLLQLQQRIQQIKQLLLPPALLSHLPSAHLRLLLHAYICT